MEIAERRSVIGCEKDRIFEMGSTFDGAYYGNAALCLRRRATDYL